ncbi:aldehyde dehydrogenase family protein, partial [Turicibacter sanguinis]|nr:aldehyde dehydrogenase family protein [Turicibacter sanguinis]
MKALNSNLTNHQTHREKQESMKTELNHILTQHQDYLEQRGGNIPLSVRIEGLKRLKETIKKYEVDLQEALKIDLGKNEFEAYSTEIGFIYASIDYTLKRLNKWARPKRVKSEAAQLIGTSLIIPSAYGVVLIIGPFNYPVQLLLEPLIGAIAGGNVAVLKPSEFTPHVESVMVRLIKEAFDSRYVSVVTGDYQVNQALLDLRFDYIFFTGSVNVGKIVT